MMGDHGQLVVSDVTVGRGHLEAPGVRWVEGTEIPSVSNGMWAVGYLNVSEKSECIDSHGVSCLSLKRMHLTEELRQSVPECLQWICQ